MKPLFLFAPGAGAPSSHPWMQRWAERLRSLGRVETFDYRYMTEAKRRPDRLPQLIEAHRQALRMMDPAEDEMTFLIGKSMGGRIGCHLSLEEKVTGLICLGYPLCGGGDRANLRDQILQQLRTPLLFVQGTRDALCPLDLLEEVRNKMQAPNRLYVVEGGDHSLTVAKRHLAANGQTQESVDQQVVQQIAGFVRENIQALAI